MNAKIQLAVHVLHSRVVPVRRNKLSLSIITYKVRSARYYRSNSHGLRRIVVQPPCKYVTIPAIQTLIKCQDPPYRTLLVIFCSEYPLHKKHASGSLSSDLFRHQIQTHQEFSSNFSAARTIDRAFAALSPSWVSEIASAFARLEIFRVSQKLRSPLLWLGFD